MNDVICHLDKNTNMYYSIDHESERHQINLLYAHSLMKSIFVHLDDKEKSLSKISAKRR